nr:DUF2892 domain-containing protein [Desulfobulbaceae bacterium]
MQKNVGTIERVIRIGVGPVMISMTFIGPESAFGMLGLVPLMTGIIGWCPPYAMFGISTCKKCNSATN